MTLTEELKDIMVDFGKYMDTTIPKDTKGDLFISLKYSNKERMRKFCKQHEIDRLLVEQVAIADFLLQDDKTILNKCREYMKRE